MTLADLLHELRSRRIEIQLEGGRLRALAEPGAIVPEVAAAIREHKAELIELLRDVQRPAAQHSMGISRAAQRERYGLSVTQQRAAVSAREGAVLPTAFRLRGHLDVGVLVETLRQIVQRHAPMRTRFFVDREPPEQEVLASVPVEVARADLSALSPDDREARLRVLLGEQRAQRFDVLHPPLFRFHLTRLGELEHVLFTAFSPLIFDGWSFDVLWNELRLGYAALVRQEPWPFPNLEIEYGDYVAWQRARLEEKQQELSSFWRDRLGAELPPLPLPTDHARPRAATTRGGNIPFSLPRALDTRMRSTARELGVTPQMMMLAGLYALFSQLGGQRRIIIGTPVEARADPSLELLIGPCVNMILLPAQVDPKEKFGDFVVRLRDECLTAYEHQEYPIELLQVRSPRSRDGGLAPAFQVELSFQQVDQRGSHMGPLALSQIELESGAATNDLTFWVKDWGDRVAGAIEFKLDLYDRETVEHWSDCYLALLDDATRVPDRPIAELDLLGEAARDRVERAARAAARRVPEWVPRGADSASEIVAIRVLDAEGRPRPIGSPGQIVLDGPAGSLATGIRGWLRHDGEIRRLDPAEPEASVPARRAPWVAPSGDLETQLVALFAEVLSVPDVGAEDNYFDLGGNSLLAVRLFGEIQRRFGVRLPLATLLTAGTPRALGRAIQNEVPVDECLIELKTGTSQEHLFLVHDADGETLLYRNLAQRLPSWLGVYAIAPRRKGRVPMVHATFEAAASHYIEELRRVQPQGPYRLGGLCAGGVLAYEMARQLVAQGEVVALLAIIDSAPPTARRRVSIAAGRAGRLTDLLRTSQLRDAPAVARAAAGKISRTVSWELARNGRNASARVRRELLQRLFRDGERWPARLEPPSPRMILGLAEREMDQTPLRDVSPVLFRASSGQGADQPFVELLEDPVFGWQQWFTRPVRIVDVPGGHSSMLQEPYVAELANRIVELLEGDDRAAPATSGAPGSGSAKDSDRRLSVRVVTVSYRSAQLVVRSLEALAVERERAREQAIDVTAVVVDNDSGDAPAIRAAIDGSDWNDWVTLIDAPRNGGFAYGNNVGFRHAWESGSVPDYFFLLNPDASVHPDAIASLVRFLEKNPRAASAASQLQGEDGVVWPYAFRFPTMIGQVISSLNFGPLYRLFEEHMTLRQMGDAPTAVDWFPGAAMMLRSEVVRQLGGMDERYFLYYEETDFCLKLRQAGWSNWYVPSSHVTHLSGKSTGVTGVASVGRRYPGYWFESRRRYFAKNHGIAFAAALDGLTMAATTLGDALSGLRGRIHEVRPFMVTDLMRHSILWPKNRYIEAPLEYTPPTSRDVDTPVRDAV